VHRGRIGTLRNSWMSCALHTSLQPGDADPAREFKVNFAAAVTTRTGEVRVENRVTSRGRRIATAEMRLADRAGTLVPLGTTPCAILQAEAA